VSDEKPPDAWAIVELMGHVRIAGRVSEEERFGSKLGRLDVPTEGGGYVTQYFSGSSVYRLTIVDEAAARAVALHNQPHPVHQWEMPKLSLVGPTPICPGCERDQDQCICDDDEDEVHGEKHQAF
jgi:hypothetical protein